MMKCTYDKGATANTTNKHQKTNQSKRQTNKQGQLVNLA